ncbi:hypothetical protein [Rhodococcus tukisamuensis]|uniref:Putative membrane protein n=1 Tax=Rhodococcus tukisamuensis TaxID=168276 RepID=A0A1G6SHJ3_9NOCA|nr:hypothetical protein [Rhodococcus tukisamuensis]SDD16308.1 putative membrane protein [Rhodococcus tukisamuensis]
MVATHANPPRNRRRWTALLLTAALLGGGVGAYFWSRSDTPSRLVAIVNEDAGASAAGKPVRAGDQVVAALQEADDFDWEVVDADTAADRKYLASVTVPADFSEAVTSQGGTDPRQAELAVHRNRPGTAADDAAITALMTTVSEQTGARGIKDLLAGVASARGQLQQTLLPAQLLTAATGAADKQAQELLAGVDSVLPYLATANDGANQLVDVAGQVAGMVDGASGPAGELSDRLTALGLSIGDVTRGTARLQDGLGEAVAVLRAPGAEAVLRASGVEVGRAVGALEQTAADLGALSAQLNSVTALLGEGVGPDTDLGDAVRSGFGQLEAVSAQLTSAGLQLQDGIGPIAAQAPELLGSTKDQILAGVGQLKSVSAQLGDQLTKGVDAIPVRNAAQQQQISSVLSAPVAVVQSGDDSSAAVFTAEHLAIVFAATTLLLAAALAWTVRRGTGVPATSGARADVDGS